MRAHLKRKVYLICLCLVLMLAGLSVPTYAAYPTGVWGFEALNGSKDDFVGGMLKAQLQNAKIYSQEDKISVVIGEQRTVLQITLVQENAEDAPVDIGTCDKYICGAGMDASSCWISDETFLMGFKVDEGLKDYFESDATYQFKLEADNLDGAPADIFEETAAGDAGADAAGDTSSSTAGDTSSSAAETDAASSAAEEVKDTSAPLHFELPGGILDYNSYEFANAGMFVNSDNDPDKTIIINFDYTNKEAKPKSYQNDFWVRAYQNGTEVDFSGSYNPEACPETIENQYKTVLENGTITVGLMFTLNDMSPVTIIANRNGGSEVSDPMELTIEPRVDNSFDLDRIYGRWQNPDTGEELTITSAQIEYQNGGSGSRMSTPSLWTDENSLHQPLSELGKTMEIIEEPGSPLRLQNENCSFVQVESWPEGEIEGGEAAVLAEREYEYYEECPALPTVSSVTDIKSDGSTKRKVNDVVTEIIYRYKGGEDAIAAYTDVLEGMGFTIQDDGGTRTILADGFKTGSIRTEGGGIVLNIEPDAYELTELSAGTALGATVPVSLGQPIETEKETFTLQKVELLPEIFPEDTSGFYFSFKADPGMVYLNAEGDLLNNGKETLTIGDLFKMEVTYADGRTYEGFAAVNKDSNNFYEMSYDEVCAPLQTCRYHFLAQLPEEAANSSEPLTLTFKLSDGQTYVYDARGSADAGAAGVYTDAETVMKVQAALNAAGYDCGTPDGDAGPKTYSALHAYQEANGLAVSDEITDEVLKALGI